MTSCVPLSGCVLDVEVGVASVLAERRGRLRVALDLTKEEIEVSVEDETELRFVGQSEIGLAVVESALLAPPDPHVKPGGADGGLFGMTSKVCIELPQRISLFHAEVMDSDYIRNEADAVAEAREGNV